MADQISRVREWRPADAAAVIECIVELQEHERAQYPRLRPGREMAQEHLEYIRRRCEESHGTVLVADVGPEIAGYVTILTRVAFESPDEPPGTYALVADLVVRERFRRQGIGADLLGGAERFARAAGASELRVNVLTSNRSAALLYRGSGFTEFEQTMVKRLDAALAAPTPPPEPVARAPEAPRSLVARLAAVIFRSRREPESYYQPRRQDFTTGCIVISGVVGAFYAGATRWELMSDPNSSFSSGFARYQGAVALGAIGFALAGGATGWVLGYLWERWHRGRRAGS